MSCNEHERRDTQLALKLKERIGSYGPMSIADYMDACLNDDEFGYYRTARVLGRDGDFITAPEISQTFGELLGLWAVSVWESWGRSDNFNLVELGAGRGTLLADALRAARVMPSFLEAVHVYIFESNPILQRQQAETLKDIGVQVSWLESEPLDKLDEINIEDKDFEHKIPDAWKNDDFYVVKAPEIRPGQTLLIANEFLDCLPVSQFVRKSDTPPGWVRRRVGLDDDGNLQFVTGRFAPPVNSPLPSELRQLDLGCGDLARDDGAIIETRDLTHSALGELYDLVAWSSEQPHAALFIDYGHAKTEVGDTLQAVRDHEFEHPLTSPGEADLSAHVDFQQVARQMREMEYAVDGPILQGDFLGRLGIMERASKLMRENPDKAGAIETSVARLMSPSGMGSRFKVIGVRSPGLAALPGFET